MTDDKKTGWDDDDGGEADPADSKHPGFTAKLLGDLAKRALTTGIGAVFMSEETLRSQLSELKLPKEAMGYVVSQADKTKRELVEVIARETRAFLSRLEVEAMIGRMLTGTTIEINTRIKIMPKEGGGIGVSVDKSDSALVKTEPAPGAVTPPVEERPRRGRRKKTKDDDDD